MRPGRPDAPRGRYGKLLAKLIVRMTHRKLTT